MSVDITELSEFITEYWRAIESELDRVGRNHFPYHQEPCLFVPTYLASDGVAIFYMPGQPVNSPPGLYVFDYSKHTLNQVVQSLHLHRIQFKVPTIGSKFNPLEGPIEFTELIPELNTYYFSEAVREALLSGERRAPGLTVAPIINVAGGVISNVYPSRVKLWSPVVEYANAGRTRYFFWNHADIWWRPESLSLPNPKQAAQLDIAAVRILQDALGTLSVEQFGRDTNHRAAENLEQEIVEFLELLAEEPDESAIHEWLLSHNHFLDATARRILNKVPFGRHISDFVVERADRTYELVEIEGVQRIFTSSGSEPSAQFNHACTQVRDWMRYINENLRTVANEQKLKGIYQPNGRVIMGRSQDIDTEEAMLRWKHLKSESLAVDTYDDIVDRVRELARTLRSILRS